MEEQLVDLLTVDLDNENKDIGYSMLRQGLGRILEGTVNKVYSLVNKIYGFSKRDSMWSILI